MKMSALPRIVERKNKRKGRGYGSGKAKTSGRGTKGQKARENVRVGFEGGQLELIKRMPLLRGRDRNKRIGAKPVTITLDMLSSMPKGTTVTLETLKKHGLVAKHERSAKVVSGKGTFSTSLTVALPCSKGAAKSIQDAGGTVQ